MKEKKSPKTERQISAGGVVFRPAGNGKTVEVALVSVKGGKVWALPKGLVEKGENIARTAHREVKEETGLDGKILKLIDHIQYFYSHREDEGVKKYFKIVYFFLMEYTGGDTSRHDHEVEECRWFRLDRAVRLMEYQDEKDVLRKARKILKELEYI